jgi:protein ImuA
MQNHLEKERRKAETFACLRREIAQLERCYTTAQAEQVKFKLPMDASFEEGGLPLGCIHEFTGKGREQEAAAHGFLSGVLSQIPPRAGVIWITRRKTVFPPGLVNFGLTPDRIIFIALAKDKDALWAMEEALRCKAVAAVAGEIGNIDLTASRRLQLAAEQGGATGFLLRMNPKSLSSSACATRWNIRPLPSVLEDGMPGVGFPRWEAELLKVRNGQPGTWQIEWAGKQFRDVTAPQAAKVTKANQRAGAA